MPLIGWEKNLYHNYLLLLEPLICSAGLIEVASIVLFKRYNALSVKIFQGIFCRTGHDYAYPAVG